MAATSSECSNSLTVFGRGAGADRITGAAGVASVFVCVCFGLSTVGVIVFADLLDGAFSSGGGGGALNEASLFAGEAGEKTLACLSLAKISEEKLQNKS